MSETFLSAFGRAPDAVFVAPGRVNLIGEYTDLNEGFVLPFAIAQSARVAVAPRSDRRLGLRSLQQDDEVLVVDLDDAAAEGARWAAYPVAVARAFEAAGYELKGADLLFDSDVPIGAGLSSSAALECATALALASVSAIAATAMELAKIAQRAENDYVGVPCGLMDQAASMCCRAGHALLLDTRSLEIRHVPFDLVAAGLTLLVVDTGVKHELGSSAYPDRRRSCEQAAAELGVRALRDVPVEEAEQALGCLSTPELQRRARHVLSEQRRVLEIVRLLDLGEVASIGPVLVDGHRSLRDDFEVSCVELDTVVDAALDAGALGARMTGGGFGGSAIVLCSTAQAERVEAGVAAAFASMGFAPPRIFATAPSPGAHRAR